MKAITLWQPWASLLACRAKQYETRSWPTKYRGPIAIHAALWHPNWWRRDTYGNHEMETAIAHLWGAWGCNSYDELPRGYVIATAELVACYRITLHGGRGLSSIDSGWLETDSGIYIPTKQELLFGDWTPGRYAWEFANMQMLPEPIPAKGKQGLWNWEPQP